MILQKPNIARHITLDIKNLQSDYPAFKIVRAFNIQTTGLLARETQNNVFVKLLCAELAKCLEFYA